MRTIRCLKSDCDFWRRGDECDCTEKRMAAEAAGEDLIIHKKLFCSFFAAEGSAAAAQARRKVRVDYRDSHSVRFKR